MKKITTLQDFAELINSVEEWETRFNDIIKENGWEDLTHTQYGICKDGKFILEFNEEGIADVNMA